MNALIPAVALAKVSQAREAGRHSGRTVVACALLANRVVGPVGTDGPRVGPEPERIQNLGVAARTESNHRHADFQHDGVPGSPRVRRRPGTTSRADRTVPPDGAYSEPEP